MSLRLAWMTSEAKTELTENSSSLDDRTRQIRESGRFFSFYRTSSLVYNRKLSGFRIFRSCEEPVVLLLPHIYDLADYYTRLCCFSFSKFVQEQFEVTDHSHCPLPALFYPSRFGHLQHRHSLATEHPFVMFTSVGV